MNPETKKQEVKTYSLSFYVILGMIIAFFIVLFGGCSYKIYENHIGLPNRIQRDFYDHYIFREDCNDKETLQCTLHPNFNIDRFAKIKEHLGYFTKVYCIPTCERAVYTAFYLSWQESCVETPYGYHLFNRTAHEEKLSEQRKDACGFPCKYPDGIQPPMMQPGMYMDDKNRFNILMRPPVEIVTPDENKEEL